MTRPERSQDMELRQTNLASRRHPALRPMIAYSRDVRVGKQAGHSFGEVSLVGKSRAVVGDQYGDTFNIEKATFSTSALSATAEHDGSCKVVRHNQIFPTYTLETVLRIQDGGIIPMRGSTSEMELRWERRNFLGAGVFGEVYREDCNVNASYPRSRAVKVLRRRQLEKLKIDYRRELDAWMCLSQVCVTAPVAILTHSRFSQIISGTSSSSIRGTRTRITSILQWNSCHSVI